MDAVTMTPGDRVKAAVCSTPAVTGPAENGGSGPTSPEGAGRPISGVYPGPGRAGRHSGITWVAAVGVAVFARGSPEVVDLGDAAEGDGIGWMFSVGVTPP
jgi:hypothetical protein